MKNINKYIIVALSALLVWSCDEKDKLIEESLNNNPDITVPPPSGDAGSLDLSTYVSIGASFTAGAMDNALYTHGQNNSFPVLLAQQFAADGVGGGAFNVPDINSVNGYSGVNEEDGSIEGKLILDLDLNNDGELGDAGIIASDGEIPGAFAGDKSTLNNFGVPGIQTAQLLTPFTGGPAEGNPAYNPLYARFASDPGMSTIIEDAVARNPTFFTLWTGGNDVLGYAASGGTNDAILTDPGAFEAYFNGALLQLLNVGEALGVVMDIPNVLALPFFQAVPYNAIPLTDQAIVDATNGAYAEYNGGVQAALANMIITPEEAALRTISFDIGANAIVIMDDDLTDVETLSGGLIPIPKLRQLQPTPDPVNIPSNELVLLPASTILGTLADPMDPNSIIGVGVPLDDEYSLTFNEIGNIITHLTAFNTTIGTAAATYSDRVMHFSTYELLLSIIADGGYNKGTAGFNLLYDFSPNGIFSNDGIHVNTRGHAIIANEIMEDLNERFGADLPMLDVMQYNASPFQQ